MEEKKKRKTNSLAPEAPFQSSAHGRVLQRGLLQLQPLLRTRPTCAGSPRRQDGVSTQGLEQ